MSEEFKDFEFIGKKLVEVEQFYNLNWRKVSEDGMFFIVTADFNPSRYNFSINNGIITSFTMG